MITETFAVGNEQVTAALEVELPSGETVLTGAIGGLIPIGTTARLRGNCRLTADLHVRGTLVCDESGVDLDGQGLYDIHTHDGTLDLAGVEKTAWCRWGETPVGWQIGDRLAVAPTAVGVYVPSETTWQGSWTATTRPANSPDVTLVDGSIAKPEVVNLSQTVTLRNLKRVMVHEASGPNPQTLKWIRVADSGETGVLGHYPIHFHMLGDNSRGSVLEGVVVEGGKNHAFVPHASHGITYTGCVAYNITDDAYWWDRPPIETDLTNDSHDIAWDDCLALWVKPVPGEAGSRLVAFMLGQGDGNRCVGSVAVCVQGKNSAAGFQWPERGEGVWLFDGCVAHNNKAMGIFVWQNGSRLHLLENFTVYRVGENGIQHGAYRNTYHYRNVTISETVKESMRVNALASPNPDDLLIFDDVVTDKPLLVAGHNQTSPNPVLYRNCSFPRVLMREHPADGLGGYHRFENCGLTPADFDMSGVKPDSIIELVEAGIVAHRWELGVWT